MHSFPAIVLALAIPAAAHAQSAMTAPVTPRTVAWYMAHPSVMQQTLRVCHSNAAYMPLPDCANAESAGAGLMKREYQQASNGLNLNDPAYWSTNPIAREGVLAQCRRRGPGDEMAYPYCRAAAASKLNDLGAR